MYVASQRELESAKQRIVDLEEQLGRSATTKVDEPFSLRAKEKRQDARGPKKRIAPRTGRRDRFTTADIITQAERSEDVVPEGLDQRDCQLSHTRPLWRLENGRSVLIAYRIYAARTTATEKSPTCWAVASSAWRSLLRLPTSSMSSASPSTKPDSCSTSSRT